MFQKSVANYVDWNNVASKDPNTFIVENYR